MVKGLTFLSFHLYTDLTSLTTSLFLIQSTNINETLCCPFTSTWPHVALVSHIVVISLRSEQVPMSSWFIELTLITQSEHFPWRAVRVKRPAMRDALVRKQTNPLFSVCRCSVRDRLARFCNGLECQRASSIVPPVSFMLMRMDANVTHLKNLKTLGPD